MKRLIFILLSMLTLPYVSAQPLTELSTPGQLNWKKYQLINNQWGAGKVKKGVYQQSIYTSDSVAGWKWKTPGKSYGVLGYPEVWYGESAWASVATLQQDNYFKDLLKLQTFTVEYDAEITVDKQKYNLAFDLWLHHSPKVGLETIGIEVMVWEDYQKFKPFGKKIGTLSTTFGTYLIYKGHLKKKELGTSWEYIAFVRTEKRTKGKVNFIELIQFMKRMNYIGRNHYLSSIEWGTEVLTSSGELRLKNYEVVIE